MDELAEQYGDDGVGGLFIYTNEAHPGENVGHITSMEEKREHALRLRDEIGVRRPILLDSLEGDCHRHFGSMPNMSWIFDSRGTALYKSDWTFPPSAEEMVRYILELPARRRAGERLVPFQVARLEYRHRDGEGFVQGLERGGPRAVTEFKEVFPTM